MTYVITSLCVRDAGCVEVCPVECIVPGLPTDKWPLFYIDPDTCIDCGACVPECPYEAIFPEDEVPSEYKARGGEYQSMPAGTEGFNQPYSGKNHYGETVSLKFTRVLESGDVVDLTPETQTNADYFSKGMGYDALKA